MPNSRYLQVRLNETQYSLLKNKMEYFGYKTLSQFVRDCIFKEDLASIKILKDIQEKVEKIIKNGKK